MTNKIIEETGEQTERRIARLDKYRGSDLFGKVVLGENTFSREAKEFYGVNYNAGQLEGGLGMSCLPRVPGYSKEEEPKKYGQIPTDLIEILDDFGDKPLNANLLEYKNVREAYTGISDDAGFMDMFELKEMGIIALGSGASALAVTYENPKLALASFALGFVGGVYLASKRKGKERKLREYRKSNRKEFLELHQRALNADITANLYREHLLKTAFNKKD